MGTLKLEDDTSRVNLEQVQYAHERISPIIRRSPLIWFEYEGVRVHLKLENMQITGAFKIRGALNKMMSLSEEERRNGVVTASAGNHGAGVAYSARHLNVSATVFVPKFTPKEKVSRLQQYGATVVQVGDTWDESNAQAVEFSKKHHVVYIHPFADPDVINGQGTIGIEMVEQCPKLDTVVAAVGGGGLIGGLSTTLKTLDPDIHVIGVEPDGAATLNESMELGKIKRLECVDTCAGSLAVQESDPLNFELVRLYTDELLTVSDKETLNTVKWLWEEYSIAVEPSAAVALAAVLNKKIKLTKGQNIGIVICGSGKDALNIEH